MTMGPTLVSHQRTVACFVSGWIAEMSIVSAQKDVQLAISSSSITLGEIPQDKTSEACSTERARSDAVAASVASLRDFSLVLRGENEVAACCLGCCLLPAAVC